MNPKIIDATRSALRARLPASLIDDSDIRAIAADLSQSLTPQADLRDQFAIAALAGRAASCNYPDCSAEVAQQAYADADAMLTVPVLESTLTRIEEFLKTTR